MIVFEPDVRWALGDKESFMHNGVTTLVRPIYFRIHATDERLTRIGTIDPEHAEAFFNVLSKSTE